MAGSIVVTYTSVSDFGGLIPTGALAISTDNTTLFTDRFSDSIYIDVSTSSAFAGSTLEQITGSIQTGFDNLIQFAGTNGIVGSITANVSTALSLENSWITGSIVVTTDSLVTFIGGMDPAGVLACNQDTVTNLVGLITNPAALLGDLTKDSSVLCMNTKTNGVSTYTKYNFNSFFKIGSDYYGCSTSGLYKLVGDTDAGTEIQATLSTPVQDFDSQKLKAIRDCYAYIRSSGDTNVRLITNEQTDRSGYVLVYDNVDGIHRRRVKVAQGLRGTTWQCIITNESGAAFELKQVDVIPKELDRSI